MASSPPKMKALPPLPVAHKMGGPDSVLVLSPRRKPVHAMGSSPEMKAPSIAMRTGKRKPRSPQSPASSCAHAESFLGEQNMRYITKQLHALPRKKSRTFREDSNVVNRAQSSDQTAGHTDAAVHKHKTTGLRARCTETSEQPGFGAAAASSCEQPTKALAPDNERFEIGEKPVIPTSANSISSVNQSSSHAQSPGRSATSRPTSPGRHMHTMPNEAPNQLPQPLRVPLNPKSNASSEQTSPAPGNWKPDSAQSRQSPPMATRGPAPPIDSSTRVYGCPQSSQRPWTPVFRGPDSTINRKPHEPSRSPSAFPSQNLGLTPRRTPISGMGKTLHVPRRKPPALSTQHVGLTPGKIPVTSIGRTSPTPQPALKSAQSASPPASHPTLPASRPSVQATSCSHVQGKVMDSPRLARPSRWPMEGQPTALTVADRPLGPNGERSSSRPSIPRPTRIGSPTARIGQFSSQPVPPRHSDPSASVGQECASRPSTPRPTQMYPFAASRLDDRPSDRAGKYKRMDTHLVHNAHAWLADADPMIQCKAAIEVSYWSDEEEERQVRGKTMSWKPPVRTGQFKRQISDFVHRAVTD